MSTQRTVNLDLVESWIARHSVTELARRSYVSIHTIYLMKNRQRPSAPKKHITRRLIAEAIGVPVDELFPTDSSAAGGSAG